MDLSMPMMAGFEATRKIRMQEENRHTPVLGMSARHWDFNWRESALKAGCTECIKKPSTFTEVNYIFKRYLDPESIMRSQSLLKF
jgi:CheY-like chemotaxis protein